MNPTAILAFFIVAFVCIVSAASQSNSTTLFLGQECNPQASLCGSGVSCYAVNSMEIPTCGSAQSTCTSTAQCATNECVNGFCSGSVLPFPGAQCTPASIDATALPCAFGASCYAVNSMEITVCGNLEAECEWDGQCAFNYCVGGFCAGALFSSSTVSSSPTSYTSYQSSLYYAANSTSSTKQIGTGAATGTGGGMTSGVGPTTSVLYVNGTATGSKTQVTSTLVVGGKTSVAGGGDTSFRQGPSQTASVQSGGARKVGGGIGALGVVGAVMLFL